MRRIIGNCDEPTVHVMETSNESDEGEENLVVADRRRTRATQRRFLSNLVALVGSAWLLITATVGFSGSLGGFVLGTLSMGAVLAIVCWRVQACVMVGVTEEERAERSQFSLRSMFFLITVAAVVFSILRLLEISTLLHLLIYLSGMLALAFLIYFPLVWEPDDHDDVVDEGDAEGDGDS